MTWALVAGLALLMLPPHVAGAVPRFQLRRRRTASDDQLMELARLLSVCLSGGLPLLSALERAGREIAPPLHDEVVGLLRRASRVGIASALLDEKGALSVLAGQLARAHVSGAPVKEAVSMFVSNRRAEVRYRSLEKARTLGVKLILPISGLLLPGFIALIIGPTVVTHLSSIFGAAP